VWRAILAVRPADLQALMGLERALTPLGRVPEMAELVRGLGATDSPGVLGLAIRVWTAARQPDSARAAVLRWARIEPTSEMPFQEWGLAAYGARDLATARAAYRLGRERLGPAAFAPELGRLAVLAGDYGEAAQEWTRAVTATGAARGAALNTLMQTPVSNRTALLAELARQGAAGDRLAAGLLVRWGEPLGAVHRIEGDPDGWDEVLAELGSGGGTADVALARARLLELRASRATGAERGRYRLEAAQAYAEADDPASARRLLSLVARDSVGLGGASLAATSAIIGVLVEDGGIEMADRRFRDLLPRLSGPDRTRLAQRLAQGWIRQGRLGRADTLLAADSTVEGLALRGRIALFRGQLDSARTLLREAGPFAGDRSGATQRIGVLGLLQVVDADSLPALGEALYRLERGDSLAGAIGLERLAAGLPPARGGAELLFLAGQLQAGLRRPAEAERLFRAALDHNVPASSAAAEFALADLLLRQGKRAQAIAALEHLLLTWPTSAVVPSARRLLDVARGAVPSS
jgi:tetratricopeptide (TPR) repeat protein